MVYRRVDIKGRLFVGVPRTALPGPLPATLCPASSPPPPHTTPRRSLHHHQHRPHLLNSSFFFNFTLFFHFGLISTTEHPAYFSSLNTLRHLSLYCVAGTCTTNTRRDCVSVCVCVCGAKHGNTHTAHLCYFTKYEHS